MRLLQNSTFLHSLFFVVGFSTVFTLLGASVGLMGNFLYDLQPMLRTIGGLFLILFGLIMAGVFSWAKQCLEERHWNEWVWGRGIIRLIDLSTGFLYADQRANITMKRRGYLPSVLLGVFFASGWIPCIGPILASILLMAAQQTTIAQGAGLLAVYSLGLGIPFLITGAALSTISKALRRLNKHVGIVSKISGFFVISMGVLMLSDQLSVMVYFFLDTFGLGLTEVENSFFTGMANVTYSIAFLAGILSFFTPCIFPVIPGYIGYISGRSLAS